MKDVPGVGVECAMKVACQAWSVGLSDIKRSVYDMKVDPHVHELELSDNKYIANNEDNKKDQMYCPSTAETNSKRRWDYDDDDGWLRASAGPGSKQGGHPADATEGQAHSHQCQGVSRT